MPRPYDIGYDPHAVRQDDPRQQSDCYPKSTYCGREFHVQRLSSGKMSMIGLLLGCAATGGAIEAYPCMPQLNGSLVPMGDNPFRYPSSSLESFALSASAVPNEYARDQKRVFVSLPTHFERRALRGHERDPTINCQKVWNGDEDYSNLYIAKKDQDKRIDRLTCKSLKLALQANQANHVWFEVNNGYFGRGMNRRSSGSSFLCREIWQVQLGDPVIIGLTTVRSPDAAIITEKDILDREKELVCAALKTEIIFAHFVLALQGRLPRTNVYSSHLVFHGIEVTTFGELNQKDPKERDALAGMPSRVCRFITSKKTKFSGGLYVDLSGVVVGETALNPKICDELFFA